MFPGDSIQVPVPHDFSNHHEFSVEPCTEFKKNWPEVSIIINDQPAFTLSNTTRLPIPIKRNQMIAQIQNAYNDEDSRQLKSIIHQLILPVILQAIT